MANFQDLTLKLLKQIDMAAETLNNLSAEADQYRPVLLQVARGDLPLADRYMRKNAISLLGIVADESCIDDLGDLLHHERIDYRANAIRSLGQINSPRAAQRLNQQLNNANTSLTEGKLIVESLVNIDAVNSAEEVRRFRGRLHRAKRKGPELTRELQKIDRAVRSMEQRD
ncbi:MAG: HEAT repeat domain-containing protein [Planctomycetota bacterium]